MIVRHTNTLEEMEMKNIGSYVKLKRCIFVFFIFCMLFGSIHTVSAASYPLLIPEEYNIQCNAGDEVSIVYTYFPEFKNERIEIEILDPAGKVVATSDRTFYHTSTYMTYTVTWDTTAYNPGKYKVVANKHFYSLYRWNTAPSPTTSYITINCSHTWNSGTVTSAPTCVKAGVKTFTCTGCQDRKTEELAATGIHNWDNGTITTVPTVFKTGVKTFKCKTCGVTKTENMPATSAEKIKSANGYFRLTQNVASGTTEVAFTMPASKNKTSIVIPDTITVDGIVCKVTSIADGAFKNNKKVKKVVIGSNVTTIGANAFSGCTKLNSLTIGNNVTSIGAKAFYKCTALKKTVIPANVSKIGKQAFYGCKNLKTLTIKAETLSNTSVGSKAFSGINKKATVKVPKKNLKAYKKLLKAKGVSSSVKIKK